MLTYNCITYSWCLQKLKTSLKAFKKEKKFSLNRANPFISDIWSLGVILYMLVCGAAPFQEANDSETLTMIMDCNYEVSIICLGPPPCLKKHLFIVQVLKVCESPQPWVQQKTIICHHMISVNSHIIHVTNEVVRSKVGKRLIILFTVVQTWIMWEFTEIILSSAELRVEEIHKV